MKLATFTHQGWTRIGLVEADEMVDLATAMPTRTTWSFVPPSTGHCASTTTPAI